MKPFLQREESFKTIEVVLNRLKCELKYIGIHCTSNWVEKQFVLSNAFPAERGVEVDPLNEVGSSV